MANGLPILQADRESAPGRPQGHAWLLHGRDQELAFESSDGAAVVCAIQSEGQGRCLSGIPSALNGNNSCVERLPRSRSRMPQAALATSAKRVGATRLRLFACRKRKRVPKTWKDLASAAYEKQLASKEKGKA